MTTRPIPARLDPKRNDGLARRTWAGGAALATARLLACAPHASAALVTRNLGVTLSAANLDSLALDVDRNGTTDFTIETAYAPDPFLTIGFDQIRSAFGSANGIVVDAQTGDGFPAASLLLPGGAVSATSLFGTSGDDADLFYYDTLDPATGNFGGVTGFVGFKFDAPDGSHFGYVQVSVNGLDDPAGALDLTLGTLAYETAPGVAVQVAAVPEPTSMTLAGIGALCFVAIRRQPRLVDGGL